MDSPNLTKPTRKIVMNTYVILIIGVLIGWCTKIPFFLSWYKSYEKYKAEKLEMYKRIMQKIETLSKEDQAKLNLTAKYFRDTD